MYIFTLGITQLITLELNEYVYNGDHIVIIKIENQKS